ncbi:MAG: tryptophan synthase subunit alpha [Thermoanaerobaculales bacterium]|nr:tryptophan synthase subunit alpha [Thermoanaerobaculales bacterium]
MSRITSAFQTAQGENRAAFIAYVTAGDPSLARTPEIVFGLASAGADIIELGVPFSDPIADGPTNQRAAERALSGGTSLTDVLTVVGEIRSRSEIPLVLFTYANPVISYGIDRFAEDAARVGVDGVLFTDVPEEELDRFLPTLRSAAIDPILLVTSTSGKARIRSASRTGGGFLYLVSRTGVTGARLDLDADLEDLVIRTRKSSRLPVAVGFGISNADQVRKVANWADGVVVGSAIVNQVAAVGDSDELFSAVEAFTRPLVEMCRKI